jgi:PAS domain S-box-containing protein
MTDKPAWPQGGAEMGALIRSHDWGATPLGPIETWPQSLRTLVDLMLDARQPAYIAWGPELTSLHNAAYIPILESKHPGALGKPFAELWPEIWDEYRSIVEATMAGEAQHFVDQPVPLAGREGRPMSWFTFSWTPARDETGAIAGFYCAATETSDKVRGEAASRERKDAALHQSEIRYRALFDSIDEGFYFARAIFDESGRCADIVYQDENPAAIRMVGQSAIGRRLSELGDYEDYWREIFGAVARTGEARRLEHYATPDGIWYDFYVFKPPQAGPDEFAVVFRDITERKQAEQRQAFLLKLSDTLRPLNSPAEVVAAASEALGSQLGAGQVIYAETDFSGEYVTIEHEWNDSSIPSNARRHRLEDFGPAFIADLRRGQCTAIEDVALDPRTSSPEAMATFERASIQALLNVPLLKNGRLIAILGVHSKAPQAWRDQDTELAKEVAERIRAAVERARAEAALRTSEERLRSALEIDTVGVVFWGSDFRLKEANQAFLAMTGFSHEEAIGLTWQELTPPEFHPASERAVAQIEATGRAEPYEKQYFRKDGSRWWGLFAPRRLSDGEVVEFALDISDRHQKQQALATSEERLRLIVENARDYAIVITDPDDIIIDWLPGAEAVFGWSREEAIGRPSAIIFTARDREYGEPEKEIATAAREGVAPDVRWHERKDGTPVFIEGTVTPLRNEDGSIRAFLKIGQDVTERRSAQEALAVSEARMRSLVTGIPQMVFRSLGTGERIWGSPQWIEYSGLSFHESLGFGWLDALHPDDRKASMDGWQEAERRGEYYVEHRIRNGATGEYRWHQTRAIPARDEGGRVLEWLGTSGDVEELRQLQRHQQTLLGELQHRVRNTLGVIRSITRRTAATSADVEEMAMHLEGRIGAFSRVQAVVTRNPDAGVDLAAMIEDELLAHAAREGEALKIEGPDLFLRPRAAETISLAIHELATNAVKYGALGSERGRIAVTWERARPDGAELLNLVWEENGVEAMTAAPGRQGFGLELLERTLPYELDAETRVEFRPEGVRFSLSMPLGAAVLAE